LQKRFDMQAETKKELRGAAKGDVTFYVSKALTAEQRADLLSAVKAQPLVKSVRLEPLGDVDHGFVLISIERVR
jgi:hypothetical protein